MNHYSKIEQNLQNWKKDHPILPWWQAQRYFKSRKKEHALVDQFLQKIQDPIQVHSEIEHRELLKFARENNQKIPRSQHYRDTTLHQALKYPQKKIVKPLQRFCKITYGNAFFYLFGTFHTQNQEFNNIGENVREAFLHSDTVFFENTDFLTSHPLEKKSLILKVQKTFTHNFIKKYPHVSEETAALILSHTADDYQDFFKKILSAPYFKSKKDPVTMDELFYQQAQKYQKKISSLTPVEQHIQYIANIFELLFTTPPAGTEEPSLRFFKNYLKNRVLDHGIESSVKETLSIFTQQGLLGQRCIDMAHKIIGVTKDADPINNPSCFVAVGILHIENIIHALQAVAIENNIAFTIEVLEEEQRNISISQFKNR